MLHRWTTSEACMVLGGWIVLNSWIRELCKVRKGLDERIDEGMLQWFSHVEMERDSNAKRVYVGEYAGSHYMGRLQNELIP